MKSPLWALNSDIFDEIIGYVDLVLANIQLQYNEISALDTYSEYLRCMHKMEGISVCRKLLNEFAINVSENIINSNLVTADTDIDLKTDIANAVKAWFENRYSELFEKRKAQNVSTTT